jgi:hypothetical protein
MLRISECVPITVHNIVAVSEETGHLWAYYIYMAVFIRNAANLTHILPKTSRTTFTSEVFLQALNRAFLMNTANFYDFLTKFQKFHSPKELKYLRGDLTKVSLHLK